MDKNTIILFIDDSSKDRVLFRHMLKEINPSIVYQTADSAEDALEFLSNAAILPDYIFLDLKLTGMSGLECLEQIKANKETARIPVIILFP